MEGLMSFPYSTIKLSFFYLSLLRVQFLGTIITFNKSWSLEAIKEHGDTMYRNLGEME